MIIGSWPTFRTVFAAPAAPLDLDGVEVWPISYVRASGFDAGITGVPTPITAFPVTLTVNGGALGAMVYDIYLSQRTDDVAAQYLALAPVAGASGSWTLRLTANGATWLGLASTTSPVTIDQLRVALKHCTVYVRRQSDGAIQLLDLLATTLAVAS